MTDRERERRLRRFLARAPEAAGASVKTSGASFKTSAGRDGGDIGGRAGEGDVGENGLHCGAAGGLLR